MYKVIQWRLVMKNKTGILLVGHGSRQKYNKEVVTTLKDKYQEIMPDYYIEAGFMELVEPNIPTSFNTLKEKGVERIIVNPVFLAHGMHTKVDIPTILNLEPMEVEHSHHHHHHHHSHEHEDGHHHHHHHHREAKSEPVDFDGEIVYLEPLGADDKIVEIVEQRINDELDKIPDVNTENTAILLIGHGSSLPYNNQVLEEIAQKYNDKSDYIVELGFMNISKPSIPEAFNKIKDKNIQNVIAVPVFLAHGIHTLLDIPTALGLNPDPIPDYPVPNVSTDDIVEFDGNIIFTEPLDADDKVLEIIDERIKEYL